MPLSSGTRKYGMGAHAFPFLSSALASDIAAPEMLIPKKNQIDIYELSFKEGMIA